jgi:hypothetical protein
LKIKSPALQGAAGQFDSAAAQDKHAAWLLPLHEKHRSSRVEGGKGDLLKFFQCPVREIAKEAAHVQATIRAVLNQPAVVHQRLVNVMSYLEQVQYRRRTESNCPKVKLPL